MDKQTLKSILTPVLETGDKAIKIVKLKRVFPKTNTYILQVHAEWLNEMPDHSNKINEVVARLFDALQADILRYITRVEIYKIKRSKNKMEKQVVISAINSLTELFSTFVSVGKLEEAAAVSEKIIELVNQL